VSSVEERVVSMTFKGEQFLAGVEQSLQALDKLNSKLKMEEGTKGLNNIGSAADKQAGSLGKIGDSVETIASKFKAMGAVGLAALTTITTQAVFAGERLIKSFTFQPIIDGFHEYETTLNSVQTILSNTAQAGTNLGDVNNALNQLNHYADQTIYNFSEMAKNIGTFTAAGVDLKTSVLSIKGLANLAALSGSSSEQASTAMYQLSQAISAGRVSLQDWNSVVNAGLGGTVFQRALAENAEKMGTLNKGAVKLTGSMKNVTIGGQSFRESITAKPGEQSWLTSDVLTRTLSQFTGDLTDAQLKAQGFNAEEIKAIQTQAKMAKNAATQVKTFSQLVQTLGEAVGSGWTNTWQIIFGDFNQAKTLFTNVSNTLGGFVQASANARNNVLKDWAKMGGRTAIIKAIGNAFNDLVAVIRPIKDAFREIFPAVTGKQLADISKSIESFTKNLMIGGTTANNLKRTFAGFFAVIDIGWQVLKQVVKTILDLVGVATKGGSGILGFTGNIGDFLVKLDQAIKKGDDLSNFFKGLGKFLAGPIELVKTLGKAFGHLFDGFDGSSAATKVIGSLSALSKIGAGLGSVWTKVGTVFAAVWRVFQPIAKKIGEFFSGLGQAVASSLSGIDYSNFLHTINTGLFAGLVLLLRKFINKFKGGESGGGGLFSSIKESFDELTGTLQQMQNVLKATTLLEIAAAVGILAVSVVALSKVNGKQLATSLTALTVMFGQLIGTMVILQKFTTGGGAVKLPIIAAGFILLATAVDILAIAVKTLAGLDWNGLAKGLVGVTVVLGALVVVAHLMPNGAKMINASLGMIAMAAAVKILASAVTDLSGLSWTELAKGLVGVGAVLLALGLFAKFAETNKLGIVAGAGLLLMAAGIKVLAGAIAEMGKLSWTEIVKGLLTMGAALLLITAAVDGMEASLPGVAAIAVTAAALGLIANALGTMGNMSWSEIAKSLVELTGALLIIAVGLAAMEEALPGAAALIVAAAALAILGTTLSSMGGMSWSEIAKSMVVLAGSLLLITAALIGMEEALPGAAALIVAAGALAILAPVMVVLGGLSWEEILKSLVALAGAFTVIGVAAALLTPVIPSIIGLAGGVALLGAAMLVAGVGVAAFGVGLTLIAASGAAAAGALVGIVTTLLGAVPQIVDLVGKLLVALLNLVINVAPKIGQAVTALISTFLDVINKLAPKIINVMLNLLSRLLDALLKYVPHMTDAGTKLITAVLNGIAKNAPKMTTAATNVIVAFINGISHNLPRIINAGLNLIVNFVNGLANGIRSHQAEMNAAGRNLAGAIIDGMTGGLASGVGRIASQARSVASSALNAAKSVLGIHSPSKEFYKIGAYVIAGFRQGLDGNKGQIDSAFNSLKAQLKSAMQDSAKDVDTLTAKLKKLEKARHKDRDAINATKKALAEAKKEHSAESKAYDVVNKQLSKSHTALDKLATQYDTVTAKLKDANDALAAAIKTRDDYNKQIQDQFSQASAPAADETAADYITALQQQVADTNTFANTVQQLRKMGLNDDAYQQLLSAGIADLPFAQNLLAGGQSAIDQVNALQKQLDATAKQLGTTASTALYQAAVDSAAGLVKGLQNQQAAIEKQMDKIADGMVKAIKKALGIKSPSRVFAEIGSYSAQGLANGLKASSDVVTASVDSVASTAVATMQKSLANMSKMTLSEIDVNPTIRPVLDLTQVKTDAGTINGILSKATLSTSGAYSNALALSAAVGANGNDDKATAPSTTNNFTQNNYSPKALSPAEIYRQTKNQISVAKGALSKT
jgi:tape measure domain-containing protein